MHEQKFLQKCLWIFPFSLLEIPRKYTDFLGIPHPSQTTQNLTRNGIETSQTIDLSAIEKLTYVRKKDMNDLVNKMDKMDKIAKAIEDLKKREE